MPVCRNETRPGKSSVVAAWRNVCDKGTLKKELRDWVAFKVSASCSLHFDLGSVRDTLLYLQSDAAATPGMERLSETLAEAIAEINRIESVSPAGEPQIISSRFLPARL